MLIKGAVVNCLNRRLAMESGITLDQSESFSDRHFSLLTDSEKMTVTVVCSLAHHTPSATSQGRRQGASSQF